MLAYISTSALYSIGPSKLGFAAVFESDTRSPRPPPNSQDQEQHWIKSTLTCIRLLLQLNFGRLLSALILVRGLSAECRSRHPHLARICIYCARGRLDVFTAPPGVTFKLYSNTASAAFMISKHQIMPGGAGLYRSFE